MNYIRVSNLSETSSSNMSYKDLSTTKNRESKKFIDLSE
jgi:hypothetical protein